MVAGLGEGEDEGAPTLASATVGERRRRAIWASGGREE